MFGAGDDRGAPVVVDHDPGVGTPGGLQRVGDDLQRLGVIQILGAQLHGADAELREPFDPGDTVNNGIETIRIRRAIRIRHARTESR